MKKKILLIDDEAWYVEPVIERLEYEGYEVHHERTVAKGLRIFKEITYDAAIVDLMLPYGKEIEVNPVEREEIPGIYIIKMVRKQNKNIPIYCYTVIDDMDIVEKRIIQEYNALHFAKASDDDELLFDAINSDLNL